MNGILTSVAVLLLALADFLTTRKLRRLKNDIELLKREVENLSSKTKNTN